MPPHFPETDAVIRRACDDRRTVAIIDDEKDIADLYCRICASRGLRVSFVAYNGAEAVEMLKRTGCPDVLLIDHRMPAMTGLEAMRRMLEIEPGARFIVLSADDDIHEDAIRAGAKAFLKKPACLGEIHRILAQVLGEP